MNPIVLWKIRLVLFMADPCNLHSFQDRVIKWFKN